jgi:hypothetical protein
MENVQENIPIVGQASKFSRLAIESGVPNCGYWFSDKIPESAVCLL